MTVRTTGRNHHAAESIALANGEDDFPHAQPRSAPVCCSQVLSGLALQRLLNRSCQLIGPPDPAACDVLHSVPAHHFARALRQANSRAWFAVEMILAGEALWERAQLAWERNLDQEFYQPLRTFLDAVSLGPFGSDALEPRRRAWQALESATRSGILTAGALEPAELLSFVDSSLTSDEARRAEWDALEQLADSLEPSAGLDLCPLFELTYGEREPLLVVLVTACFRQAVESDPDLFGDLAFSRADNLTEGLTDDFLSLAVLLDRHGPRLASLLGEVRSAATVSSQVPQPSAGAGSSPLERGLACMLRGDYERAAIEFTAVLQTEPGSATLFAHRGDAYRLKGDHTRALADYNTALQLDPANALVLLNRGQVYWLLGRHEEAVADCSGAIQLQSENAIAFINRGKARAALGDLDGAVADFSESLRLDPTDAWSYHYRGDAHVARRAFVPAIADYSRAVRLNPLATLSFIRRGDAYRLHGDPGRAVADYHNAVRLDPFNALAYLHRGAAHRDRAHIQEAQADFSRALQLGGPSAELFHERGLLHQSCDRHDQALADFNDALRLDPGNAELFYLRALTNESLGNTDAAVKDYSDAVRLDPSHAAAYNGRGQIYAQREETDQAVADFDAALRIDPQLAEVHVNRARALLRDGRLDDAVAACDQALQLDERLGAAHLVRGHALAQKDDHASALQSFSQAVRISPDDSLAWFLRGLTLVKLDDNANALTDMTRSLRLNPEQPKVYAHRALIHRTDGRQDRALSDLAHSVRLDERFAPAYSYQSGLFHAGQRHYEQAVADFTVALLLDPNNSEAETARNQALLDLRNHPRPIEPAPQAPPKVEAPIPLSEEQVVPDVKLGSQFELQLPSGQKPPVEIRRDQTYTPQPRPTAMKVGAGKATAVLLPTAETAPEYAIEEADQADEVGLEVDEAPTDDEFRREQEQERERQRQQQRELAEKARLSAAALAHAKQQRQQQAAGSAARRVRLTEEDEDDRVEAAQSWRFRRNMVILAAGLALVVFLYGGYVVRSMYRYAYPVRMAEVPIEDIANEFAANPSATAEKYVEKRVVFTGKLLVQTDKTKRPAVRRYYFDLPGQTKDLQRIECDFADADEASSVSSGKVYKISGMVAPADKGSGIQVKFASVMGGGSS